MKKGLFFRKCVNANNYFDLCKNYPSYGSELEYKVVKVIQTNNYEKFISNFLKDDIIIKNVTHELFMDENDCVHVALITKDYNSGFLIYPAGYNYARYVAFWSKDKDGDYNV